MLKTLWFSVLTTERMSGKLMEDAVQISSLGKTAHEASAVRPILEGPFAYKTRIVLVSIDHRNLVCDRCHRSDASMPISA